MSSPTVLSPQLLPPHETRRLARALTTDYEAFLRPGERFEVQVELATQFRLVQIILDTLDRSERILLEAALVEEDLPEHLSALPAPRESATLLLAFLRVQLYDLFRQDRQLRLHHDWKIVLYEGQAIRWRGERSQPELERLADALLGEDGALDA